MPTPRPLYRLGDLLRRPDDQVLIVEGERKADDAAMLLPDLIVVSWAGGAKAIAQSDWRPLRGRRVLLWPDNDQPGDDAMARLAGLLADAREIKLIRRDPDKPKGWDVGDAIREDRWTAEQVVDFMRSRVEVWAAPDDVQNVQNVQRSSAPSATVVQLRTAAAPAPVEQAVATTPYSEDHIALEFSRRHVDTLRYVATWGKWFLWTGAHWREEQTHLAFELARRVAREFAAAANDFKPGSGKSIVQSKTFAGVIKIAQGDRRHAVLPDIWDRNPWLLNTPGGTVDLTTGELRPHRQSDHITKMTGVTPDPDMATPIWAEFLVWMTGGDDRLLAFLRRMIGYALTGDTREHALFFLYGTGGNGKGTFLNTVVQCMGDYARTSPIETFTESKGERHPTELAMLRGARLVAAQETEEGRRWAEARIKALTGGDRIAARFMRQDFFEFTPEFKLIIAGNHKPGLRSVDAAIRRRFHLVPFTAAVSQADADLTLGERLRAEWPGILHWAIQGAIEWQEMGLRPPLAVTQATEEYLSSEDAVAAWIADECETGANASDHAGALYASWKKWSEANGEFTGSQKRFAQQMVGRGFPALRGNRGERMHSGIRVRAEQAGFYDSP